MFLDSEGSSLVFVYGALRSGTTVFRLMLDSHSNISNPGEMDFLFDFLHRDSTHPTQWRYDLEGLSLNRIFQSSGLLVTEGRDGLDLLDDFLMQTTGRLGGHKCMSINVHRHIDVIFEIFPQTRCIHMLRDPRDVARSSIAMGWAYNIYYGVNHWIGTEQAWDRGAKDIPSSQLLTLTYEGLFRNIDTELHAVCDFLGVDWDAGMLRYHETSTYGPPDPELIEQWRHKCTQADLDLLEGKAGPLMLAKGYALSGKGYQPTKFEKLKLAIRQKLFLWGFGVQRYGIVCFYGEKLTRSVKLKGLQRYFRQQMNVIDKALVK